MVQEKQIKRSDFLAQDLIFFNSKKASRIVTQNNSKNLKPRNNSSSDDNSSEEESKKEKEVPTLQEESIHHLNDDNSPGQFTGQEIIIKGKKAKVGNFFRFSNVKKAEFRKKEKEKFVAELEKKAKEKNWSSIIYG